MSPLNVDNLIKKDELIELCSKIIQIPSDNPPGNTVELATFMKEHLAEHGIQAKLYETKKGIVNIVASLGSGEPHLVLNGHLDQFPAEIGEKWSIPPYSGRVKDGRIYGRGSGDMKGGLASLLYCFAKLIETEFSGKVTFTGTSDEETGGEWGALWLLDNVPDVLGDAVLNGEPSGLTVRIGEKGRVPLILEAEGKAAHGSFAGYVGENAIMKMVKVLPAVESFQGMPARLTAESEELTLEVMKGYAQQYGHESKTMADVLRHVTVNIGVIHGGTKENIVPAKCRTDIDLRLPLGIMPTDIKTAVEERIHEIDPSIKISWGRPTKIITESTFSSPDAPITKIVAINSQKVTGVEPLMSFTSGGTDCRFWRQRGVPAIGYGPRVYAMGGVDENIPVDDLIATAKVHMSTILDFMAQG